MADIPLLKNLCEASGISGFEDEVRKIMRDELKKTCDSVEVDNFGNVIAKKGNGKKKIMLAAHMDEVGFMVKHISKEGFVTFIAIGGIDERILIGQNVIIKTKNGDVTGIIGSKPPHLQKDEERKVVIKREDLFIDIGVRSDEEAKKIVEVGDPVIFPPNFGKLNNLYYGKAVDDRIGCYILIEVMRRIPKNLDATIYAVATTQEEVGLKGSRVAAFKINPDLAIVIDTGVSGDTPQITEKETNLKLSKGPEITIIDANGQGIITPQKIKDVLINTAKKGKIPYQIDVTDGGGVTDATIIIMTREGIPCGTISIPTRYIHSQSSVFDIEDAENAVKLILESLPNFE